jgi:hypothetical protein
VILEALTWLVTPCDGAARRLGYLGAAIGLQARAQRCRKAWVPHMEQARQAVTESIARSSGRGTALVLGSGLGLEYSLAQLAAEFRQVILVDVVHLPSLRRATRRYRNVSLLRLDLSGAITGLAALPPTANAGDLNQLAISPPGLQALKPDWVLSANLLSQLPLLPAAWLEKHCPAIDAAAIEAFGRRLMRQHLQWLEGFEAPVCLIADAAQTLHDADGQLVEHTDLAAPLGFDNRSYAHWEWTLAPPGELPDGLSSRHQMVACHRPAPS